MFIDAFFMTDLITLNIETEYLRIYGFVCSMKYLIYLNLAHYIFQILSSYIVCI